MKIKSKHKEMKVIWLRVKLIKIIKQIKKWKNWRNEKNWKFQKRKQYFVIRFNN